MSAKKEKTPLGLLLGLIGRLVTISMMFLTAWTLVTLLRGLYLPKKTGIVIEESKKSQSLLEKKMGELQANKEARKHFHNVDKTIFVDEKEPPICLTCHGNLPHSKALQMRSLLNMHTYFIACEVCHIRSAAEDSVYYAWFDFKTHEKVLTLNGPPGDYGAKIVPVKKEADGSERRLDKPLSADFAKEFIEQGYKWSLEQRAKAKTIIHEGQTKNPVLCNECHTKKNAYLPFEDLHYTEKRAAQLEGTEAAGMVEKYIKFYLPTMFDPVMARKRDPSLVEDKVYKDIGEELDPKEEKKPEAEKKEAPKK